MMGLYRAIVWTGKWLVSCLTRFRKYRDVKAQQLSQELCTFHPPVEPANYKIRFAPVIDPLGIQTNLFVTHISVTPAENVCTYYTSWGAAYLRYTGMIKEIRPQDIETRAIAFCMNGFKRNKGSTRPTHGENSLSALEVKLLLKGYEQSKIRNCLEKLERRNKELSEFNALEFLQNNTLEVITLD